MKTTAADHPSAGKGTAGRVAWPAIASAAATTVVAIPLMLRDPSTTQAVPAGWSVAMLLAAPLTAYVAGRRVAGALNNADAFLIGLPQLPLIVLLSTVTVWLDVQRGHLLAGSGEEAMSYGLGTTVAFVAGIILLSLVAAAAKLGARRRAVKKVFD